MQNLKSILQKKALLILMIPSICLCLVYKYTLVSTDPIREFSFAYNSTDYILYNSKCRIPNIDPFNSEVKGFYKKEKFVPCSKLDLLTYVTKNNDSSEATLHIDKHLVPSYSKAGVICCISNVTRGGKSGSIDNSISLSKCEDFTDSVALPSVPVVVKCRNAKKSKKNVYNNAHAPVTITKRVQEKLTKYDRSQRPLNVLFVGFDSISRLNSMRVMPLTRGFLEENDWLEMQGYNKIGDNTFPNLMAILTGRNSSRVYDKCNPSVAKKLDACNLLWYDFRKLGYVTAYGEDHFNIGTFNYLKKGFVEEPVDYYFRPYVMASEQLKKSYVDDMLYCAGPLSCTERVLNAAEDFAVTFKDVPNFGFFWMNHAHNKLNSATRLDFITKNFLEKLKHKGILENSIVLFLSDHGLRFGKILYTYTGWLEERLPMLYMWVPKWFRETFPLEYDNMRLNTNKLTTPYDVHMTIQDILVYAGTNYTINQSEGCPKCKSLFSEIPIERSCEEASIDFHWCTCTGYKYINGKNKDIQDATKFILDSVQEIVSKSKEAKKCAKYSLKKLISSRIFNPSENWYKNDTYLLIIFETKPSAVFEATVKLDPASPQRFSLQGGLSRLDQYKHHAHCVDSSYLKMYCYCK